MESQKILAIEGPQFDISSGIIVKGREIHVSRDPSISGTGGSFWDASLVLLRFLEENLTYIQGKIVLELGAGLGLTSIGVKIIGCNRIIATDISEVVSNIRKNVELNAVEVECRSLDWYSPEFFESDLVIMADVVWVEGLITPLVSTLDVLMTENNLAVICLKVRSNLVHQKFLDALMMRRLRYSKIFEDSGHEIAEIRKISFSNE